MFCEQCGSQLKDTDKFCQNCGWKAPVTDPTETVEVEPVVAEEPAAVEAAPVVAEEPVTMSEPTPDPYVVPGMEALEEKEAKSAATPVAPPAKAPVKKKGKGKKAAIIIGVIAVVLVVLIVLFILLGILAFFFIPPVKNFFMANFASPEKYYQYVEARQADAAIKGFVETYENELENMKNTTNAGSNYNMSITLGDKVYDMLEDADVDISWIESINIKGSSAQNEDAVQSVVSFGVNGKDAITADVTVDYDEEQMFLQFPELSDSYLYMDISDYEYDSIIDSVNAQKDLADKLPESAEIESVLKKYSDIIIESSNNVKKSKETITIDNLSKKCTVLEVTYDEETIVDMAVAICTELNDDDVALGLIEVLFEQAAALDEYTDADELMDDFKDALEEVIEDGEDNEYEGDDISMTLYVDGLGNIIGRTIEIEDVTFSYMMIQKGTEFEVSVELIDDEDMDFVVDGSGILDAANLTGEFYVYESGAELFVIEVADTTLTSMSNGDFSGKIAMKFGEDMDSYIEAEMGGLSSSDELILSAILDASLDIEFQGEGEKTHTAISVNVNDNAWVTITSDEERTEAGDFEIPSEDDAYDLEDVLEMDDYYEEIDFDEYFDMLEDEVGVDSDIVDIMRLYVALYVY